MQCTYFFLSVVDWFTCKLLLKTRRAVESCLSVLISTFLSNTPFLESRTDSLVRNSFYQAKTKE